MRWRTIHGPHPPPSPDLPELEVLIRGLLTTRAPCLEFLLLLRSLRVRRVDRITKVLAGYHQFNAVNLAVQATIEASPGPAGYRRAGCRLAHARHRQKPFRWCFTPGRSSTSRPSRTPPLSCMTDRNDLDDQLFATVLGRAQSCCGKFLSKQSRPGTPQASCSTWPAAAWCSPRFRNSFPMKKATSSAAVTTGGNIVVIADEAHRSQYDFIDGFAKHMRDALPKASFIGFTARRSKAATRTRRPCSAITLTFTTSCNRRKTRPPCRFITKGAWRSST